MLLAGGLLAVLGQAERHGVGGEAELKYRTWSMCPLWSIMTFGAGTERVKGGDPFGVMTL